MKTRIRIEELHNGTKLYYPEAIPNKHWIELLYYLFINGTVWYPLATLYSKQKKDAFIFPSSKPKSFTDKSKACEIIQLYRQREEAKLTAEKIIKNFTIKSVTYEKCQ